MRPLLGERRAPGASQRRGGAGSHLNLLVRAGLARAGRGNGHVPHRADQLQAGRALGRRSAGQNHEGNTAPSDRRRSSTRCSLTRATSNPPVQLPMYRVRTSTSIPGTNRRVRRLVTSPMARSLQDPPDAECARDVFPGCDTPTTCTTTASVRSLSRRRHPLGGTTNRGPMGGLVRRRLPIALAHQDLARVADLIARAGR
jgi:hypothetical protein